MSTATLTAKGQVVIPAEIRRLYQLTPGTQIEFLDDAGTLRLVVRRRTTSTEISDGFGMIKVKPSKGTRRLADFDDRKFARRAQRLALTPKLSLAK